ncbi:hypothetical protein SAMN04488564_103991 [Lentzea waywayandensis]|uniref:Uncharacterized protein n=1 Tax=Lentzea waywayandensis TaxID=84724 RepID=A0A1I6E6N5_9PSEU|nr:hypothetical protein [Lentzea waywayandensis]SFR13317.1 hypothetical protein SAMN04488564_103991 [Lentzea waywayandensis]
MSRFEDNLWAELERGHAPVLLQSVATQRRLRMRRWMGAAAGVVVLGAAAVIAPVYFGGTPPAYAVVDNPDGSVTLTIREVQRFEEATAKLRERGIPAIAVPLREGCVETGRSLKVPVAAVDFEFTAKESKITITPDGIPPDATVVLAADSGADVSIVAGGVYARDQLPGCLPVRGR